MALSWKRYCYTEGIFWIKKRKHFRGYWDRFSFWIRQFFACCHMHFRMFCSFQGLYQPYSFSSLVIHEGLQTYQVPPGGKMPPVTNHWATVQKYTQGMVLKCRLQKLWVSTFSGISLADHLVFIILCNLQLDLMRLLQKLRRRCLMIFLESHI